MTCDDTQRQCATMGARHSQEPCSTQAARGCYSRTAEVEVEREWRAMVRRAGMVLRMREECGVGVLD